MKTAQELGIGEEEYQALLATRKKLTDECVTYVSFETDDLPRKAKKKALFNMNVGTMSYSCGTVACIGGWMAIHMKGFNPLAMSKEEAKTCDNYVIHTEIGHSLRDLFYPPYPNDPSGSDWNNITTEQAVMAIDNFLEHGEPRWETILEK